MAFVKRAGEIKKIRKAGAILAELLDSLKSMAKPGVHPKELDRFAEEFIRARGAVPSFLGYQPYGAERPFPATICASLNDVIVHGVPTAVPLQAGDVFTVDVGVQYEGYHADAAYTLPIGEVPKRTAELIEATEEALQRAIAEVLPGKTLGDIGYAIQGVAEERGFTVIQGLGGHGIGRSLHEDPFIMNEEIPEKGMRLLPNAVVAIEPMFSLGSARIRQLKEDESYATRDGSLSAHFEHTVLVTPGGSEVLTML